MDAIDAPVWGIVFDKTHSRWGKSRPWFLWLCVPFAAFGVLTFLTPNFGNAAKIFYAAATYIVCSVLYTGINTPVTSILSALTPDPRERVTLTCFRMFGSKLGVLFVNLTALKLVQFFGHGDDRKGFMIVMPIYATGTVLLFLTAFWNLEELKEIVVEEKKPLPIADSFRALKGNWPWLIIFASSLLFWIAFIARVSVAPYFFEYTLHRKDLIPTAFALDFISLATAFGLPFFCKWTSKRNVWMIGLLGLVVGQLIVWLGVQKSFVAARHHVRLGLWISGERHGDGDAIFRFVRQRGLWRMENRHPRRGIPDSHRRGILPESRQWSRRRAAGVDHAVERLRAEREADRRCRCAALKSESSGCRRSSSHWPPCRSGSI